jgi:acetyl esterase/lipase
MRFGRSPRLDLVPAAKPDACIEDATFPVGPKGCVRVRIIRPKNGKQLLRAVMYFHGGGWANFETGSYTKFQDGLWLSRQPRPSASHLRLK